MLRRVTKRVIDDGTRIDEHEGIVFRAGPTGRRAALAGGPDVWEVMLTIRMSEADGQVAVAAAAETLGLTHHQVLNAIAYYRDFPAEIDERVEENLAKADRAEAAWVANIQPNAG